MGKAKWKDEELNALIAGVTKHGIGNWRKILRDHEFAEILSGRSNIDLKDKWRNIKCNSTALVRTPKLRAAHLAAVAAADVTAAADADGDVAAAADADAVADAAVDAAAALAEAVANISITSDHRNQNSAPAAPPAHIGPSDTHLDDRAVNTASNGKIAPRYDDMIYEALSALGDSNANGSNFRAIIGFIEQKHEVPPKLRKAISSRLRKLTSQNKLQKIENLYKICDASEIITKPPKPKPGDVRIKNSNNQDPGVRKEKLEAASLKAAHKVAKAENDAYLAAKAVKKYEQIKDMTEEAAGFMQIAEEIYERCRNGEKVIFR